ncbi:MAG: AsmA family protein [Bacteroidetes bacterium]|nr:MAG: AsmA family protein [Bacteroidota bacterium]
MKIAKRLLLTLFILVALLLGALVAIPYFFKDEVVAMVKEEANNAVNATIDFKDVDLSLIRSFPDLNLRLEGLSVVGKEPFEGLKLVGMDQLDITLDLMSVINSDVRPVELKSVGLIRPEINILVLKDGRANYDISKPAEADTTASTDLKIDLQKYWITDGKIVYDDRTLPFFLEMDGVNHTGRGDFTLDVFDLQTESDIAALTVDYDGVRYIKGAHAKLNAGFNIDMLQSKYTLKENDLQLNDLKMKADGWIAMPAEDIDMDLQFSSPSSDFKSLLSVIPNAYTEGFESVKATGKFDFNGTVKGTYGDSPERYPAFAIHLNVDNGNVQYPDLPMGIAGIFAKMTIENKTDNLNTMVVDVPTFKMKIGNNPVEARLALKTLMTDPFVDTRVKGKIDLAELAKAFPMEGVREMNGIINSDVTIQTNYSTIEKARYEKVKMDGHLTIEQMNYVASDMPPVKINRLETTFSPQSVRVAQFDARLGKSDLNATGAVDNLLAWFAPDKTMTGQFTVRSKYFNADEWMTDAEPAPSAQIADAPPVEETEYFNRFDFALDGKIDRLDYDVYQIENLVTKGRFTPNELKINAFGMKLGESDLAGSGNLTNVWNYVFKNETLGGKLNLRSNFFDLNPFMTESETPAQTSAPAEPTEPILVPENMDIVVTTNMNRVRYDNMDLENITGRLLVKNQAVRFEDVKARALGGEMGIEGGYDTKDPEKPTFDFAYDLKNLSFSKAFSTFNTIEKIAPIGKFIEGNFDSKMKMSSVLGKDLMPDLSTLFAEGLFQTINGKIANFPVLQKIGNALDIREFKNPIPIKDSKNWFTVKNGMVDFQEQKYKVNDIELKVGGSHQLTGGMNYAVIAKIPREKLGKNPVGAAAESGLNFLNKQAAQLGINLDAGEFVNVQINITGSLADPKLKFKLLGSEGEGSVKSAVAENAKDAAKAELDKAKEDLTEKATEVVNKKATEVFGKPVDSVKTDLKDKADKAAEEAAKKAEEALKKKMSEEEKKKLEEAKDKLKDLNPFKKKKKGEGGGR